MTGKPPFHSSDPLELIHSHLAKPVPSIIPRYVGTTSQPFLHALLVAVQRLLQKMLSKQAEDRYQSSQGLIHDLSELLKIIHARSRDVMTNVHAAPSGAMHIATYASPSAGSMQGKVKTAGAVMNAATAATNASDASAILSLQSFEIGKLDLYSTFRISQRLYGREDEVHQLIERYQQVCGAPSSAESLQPPCRLCLSPHRPPRRVLSERWQPPSHHHSPLRHPVRYSSVLYLVFQGSGQ